MFAGVFDEFFGVPTHPLAVHAPVVLIPLLTVVSVVVLVKADWARRSTLPLAGVVFVMAAMLFVAKQSGESVKEANNVFGDITSHEDLGNQTFVLGVVWFLLAGGAALAQFIRSRGAAAQSLSASAAMVERDRMVLALSALAAVASIVVTVWLIRTGHAGAESRWKF